MMNKRMVTFGLLAAAACLLFAAPSWAAKKPTVKLGISSWIGYGPVFIAEKKGFFQDEGVNVELHRIEKGVDRRSALAAGAIVGYPTTVDGHIATAAAGVPVVQVVALDDSHGADGLVARKGIKSFEELEGKKVGLEIGGGSSYFWALYMLSNHDMTLDDLDIQNMSSGASGAAFASGRLDAAFTWEPWLTTAEKSPNGHILISSKETPGVIVDTIGFRRDFVEAHPEAVQSVVDGVMNAMHFIKTNREQAYAIMAKAMNMTSDDFATAAKGVRFYGLQDNLDYFGTEANPGPIYKLADMAAKLLYNVDAIDNKPDVDKTIDPHFVHEAAAQ